MPSVSGEWGDVSTVYQKLLVTNVHSKSLHAMKSNCQYVISVYKYAFLETDRIHKNPN